MLFDRHSIPEGDVELTDSAHFESIQRQFLQEVYHNNISILAVLEGGGEGL